MSTYLYVGNGYSRDITAFRVNDHSGELTPTGTFPIPGLSDPLYSVPLATSPDKRLLFAAIRTEPWSVRSFAIDAESGRLAYLGSGVLADNACYISLDKSGRFLFSASYTGNKVTVNPVSATGMVSAPLQVIPTKAKSHSILVDAANRYALSACLGGDVIYQWRFDAASGQLSPNEPPYIAVGSGSGPRHLIFHPNGRVVYLLNEHTTTICVYDYDPSSGRLNETQVASAMPSKPGEMVWASDIHVTPDGRFVYAAERGSSTLAILEVDPVRATLSPRGHVDTETQPRSFAIEPTGRFLYCVGQLSDRMSSYSIDGDTGHLTKLAHYPVGKNPNWIEVAQVS